MINKTIKEGRYFSLVLKTVLAVSFVTIAASSSVFFFGKIVLENNYENERTRERRFHQQAFNSILERSKLHDVNIGWLLPAFLNPQISPTQALEQIKALIDANWFKIELESDIQSAYLLSKKGDLIDKWGETSQNIDFFLAMFDFVVQNEQPTDKILCDYDCNHYYVTPFLHKGRFIGVFIFGVDLAETVLQMHGITGADIGILVKQQTDSNKQASALQAVKIIALTRQKTNLPLLKELMAQYPDGYLQAGLFNYKQKSYEISTIPFSGQKNSAELIIIDDVTELLAETKKATALYAANGVLSLLLSGGIILLLLIRSTNRLRALITVLPLIAEKKYSEVMKYLPKKISRTFLRDEVNVLDEATHNLFITLQELDNEVDKRTKRLSERTIELQKEKKFISNILDTAQVIIMTLDDNAKIITINKYAENLTGIYDPKIKNIIFTDLIFGELDLESISAALKELAEQHRITFRHECFILSNEGTELYISWFFTLINDVHEASEILVVGLDLTERRNIEQQLSWLADHDPLTNLFNRRRFEQELQRTLSLATRYNQSGALIFFDIDQFKIVNDSSGHKVGDELLVKIAEQLLSVVRKTDFIARFGGDEFVVLAPQITQQNAQELVQKICDAMTKVEISVDRNVHRVSISAGLLIYPVTGYTEQDLMASVDLAMYKAKEMGRGGWCLASIADLNREEVRRRVNWKSSIETALRDNRFLLYFQPIMLIADKSISHYECLLRMIDDDGNIIPPGMFISVAEQTGLMMTIDKIVLKMAVKHQENFIAKGLDLVLSVNLSAEMISNPDAFKIVNGIFNQHAVPISKFMFEITETQAVTNLQSAQKFIQEITEAGGQFALDDFGVGFSSMSHLKQLPVQFLKIDGGFVKNLTQNREDRLFVNAINSVGQGMGLKTIAEFVEDEYILETLFLIGVDYAQGYGIGRPMPKPEFHLLDIE
jgi:diguanylate cyclase (GGDEF)-like protein/PAS domain S-box-containing protein